MSRTSDALRSTGLFFRICRGGAPVFITGALLFFAVALILCAVQFMRVANAAEEANRIQVKQNADQKNKIDTLAIDVKALIAKTFPFDSERPEIKRTGDK